MRTVQARWMEGTGWDPTFPAEPDETAQLVLLFGSTPVLKSGQGLADVKRAYPGAQILGCSTSGEIVGTRVYDDSLVATAVEFEHTRLRGARVTLSETGSSFEAGKRLGLALPSEGLVHVFVLSDGLAVNGSELVAGLTDALPSHVTLTGGLSADGARFEETLVLWNGEPRGGDVAALGFYGDRLRIGYGSLGGWDPFGPERLITRSTGNTLHELDGKPVLPIYKQYLGELAEGLPATALLFPLSLRSADSTEPVVRTVLAVNEDEQSITFAGDMPEGSHGRFMKANFERLIDGAAGAARTSHQALRDAAPELAILISCVGRKLILKQRIEEEVEGVQEVFGDETVMTGFYSYGEISPFTPGARCELHNQTMTITPFAER